MSDLSPLFTIIIATCGRPERLAKTLEFVREADEKAGGGNKLIVADNHPHYTGRSVAEAFSASSKVDLQYLQTSPRNKSKALNAAIAVAETEWLAFTDDDTEPDELWLVEASSFIRGSGLKIVGGQVVVGGAEVELPLWLKAGRSGRVPWGPAFVHFAPKQESGVLPEKTRLPLGANLFVHKSIFDDCGGYDEALWDRCGAAALGCEDGEFAVRVQSKGIAMGYCAESKVFHPVLRERTRLCAFLRYAYYSGFREPLIFGLSPDAGLQRHAVKRIGFGMLKGLKSFVVLDLSAAVCDLLDVCRAMGVLVGARRERGWT